MVKKSDGMSWGNRFKSILKYCVPIVIFYYLGKSLLKQWESVKNHTWDFDLIYLALSFLALFLTLFLIVLFWNSILKRFGLMLPLLKTFKIFHLSQLGRYIPGKVWQFVGMYYLMEQEGAGGVKASSTIIWTNIFFNISGLIVGSFSILAISPKIEPFSWVLLTLFILLTLLLIHPLVIDKVVNTLLKLLKREMISISMPYASIFMYILLYSVAWLSYGAGFFFLAKSLTNISISLLPDLIGIYAVANVIGYLSFLSPGGLGVREGVLSYLLSYYIPVPVAMLISIVARIWFTIGELVCTLIALRIR